jgi:F0F1-type ATP synthase assembly protein I
VTKSFYLNNIVYYITGSAAVVFVISYFQPAMYRIGGLILLLLVIAVAIDAILIYSKRNGVNAERTVTDRFSIGDQNKIVINMIIIMVSLYAPV